MRSAELRHRQRGELERMTVPRRAQRQVELIGPGLHIRTDAIDDLLDRSHEHRRPHQLCDLTELLLQRLLVGTQPDVDRTRDVVDITPQVRTVGRKHLALSSENLGRHRRGVPAIGPSGDDLQRPALAPTTDPDRDLVLYRPRLVARLHGREIAAGEVRDLIPKEASNTHDGLLEAIESSSRIAEVDAVRLMLLAIPPCTATDLPSTARQMVPRAH